MIPIIILEILFSTTFPLAKQTLHFSSIPFFIACRMLLSGPLFLLYLFFFNRRVLFLFQKKEWLYLFFIGLFSIYITNVWEYFGLKALSTAKTCLIYSLTPYFSALFSYWILKETISQRKWIAIVGAGLGLSCILFEKNQSLATLFFIISVEEWAVLGAAVAAVYGWIFTRRLMCKKKHSAIAVNGWSMLIGGSFSLIHSFYADSASYEHAWDFQSVHTLHDLQNILPLVKGGEIDFLLWMGITTLISNYLCYNLSTWLLQRFTTTYLSLAGGVTPLFAAFFSWIFFHERVAWNFWLACILILPSLYLFHSEEIKHVYVKK